MITIQVAGKECTVEQAERSYSALLRSIAEGQTTGCVPQLNTGQRSPSYGEWWIGFERTDREFYQRHGPQARELKGDTSTSVDIFIWKLGFEEAFAASNMEWVEGSCPFLNNRWDVELAIPGYLAYDVFTTKVPVRYAERLLIHHRRHFDATDPALHRLGLKSRMSLGQTDEGRTEWIRGCAGDRPRRERWFTRLSEQINTRIIPDPTEEEPQTYGFESLEEVKATLRHLILHHRDTDHVGWCLDDTNTVLSNLNLTITGHRESEELAIAEYITHFAKQVERHGGRGFILEELKQYKQPWGPLPHSKTDRLVAAGAAVAEGLIVGIQADTKEDLQQQAQHMAREAARGMLDAPEYAVNELCTPIRVRDFLIELSEQTGNEGIVNEWLDQLGLAPYSRRYAAAVRIQVQVDATTPARATEILREAQWSTTDGIEVDDAGVLEIRLV